MNVLNESEMGMERWSVYNCRPVEASVELTSPYTGKVVKVHHKAMGKLWKTHNLEHQQSSVEDTGG